MKNKKKLSNVIKLKIERDAIRHRKKCTRVLDISNFERIFKIINNIGLDDNFKLEDNFKLMINFKTEDYYLLQTTSKELDSVDDDEIRTEFIVEMYKKFYSIENFEYDEKLLKNNKRVVKEIAPYKFNVTNSYIEEDRGYCVINIIENINKIKDIRNIIDKHDIWLIIDFNKLDQEKMLNTIARMEENKFDKVKVNKFIKKHIYEFKEKLKNEDVIQCEFKMLHFDNNLESLNENNVKLINKFRSEGINMFQVKERLNLIKAFNSSIYPYLKLEVTHSLNKYKFIELLGWGV